MFLCTSLDLDLKFDFNFNFYYEVGYTQQDHLCLFEFHFVNGGIVPPTLVNSKNLPGISINNSL